MAYTVAQIDEALKAKAGNVTAAASALGASRSTIYNQINASPTLRQALVDYRESLVDIAESALRKGVLEGNMTAIIFTLKTVGKGRGYVERSEWTGKDGGAIDINISQQLETAATAFTRHVNNGAVGREPNEISEQSDNGGTGSTSLPLADER